MTAVIPTRAPAPADLALLRLGLTDERRARPTRIGQHGPEALRPPRKATS